MKNFLVLFREPEGRNDVRTDVEITNHQQAWQQWMEKYMAEGKIAGGNSLTLQGKIIKGPDGHISDSIHYVGTEIVGGFLLLKAGSLDEAAHIVSSCPVYQFGGYAEVREY